MSHLESVDLGILYGFDPLHRAWLDQVVVAGTQLGNLWVALGVAVLGVLGFLLARKLRMALLLACVAVLAVLLANLIPLWVPRERPMVSWHLITVSTPDSFPSAHALLGMAIYGSLGLLLARLVQSPLWQALIALAGLALGLWIGFTRVYAGVEWPMDVLTGWAGGLFCALLAYRLSEELPVTQKIPRESGERE